MGYELITCPVVLTEEIGEEKGNKKAYAPLVEFTVFEYAVEQTYNCA